MVRKASNKAGVSIENSLDGKESDLRDRGQADEKCQ